MPIFSHNGIFWDCAQRNNKQGVSLVVSLRVHVKAIEPCLDCSDWGVYMLFKFFWQTPCPFHRRSSPSGDYTLYKRTYQEQPEFHVSLNGPWEMSNHSEKKNVI